MATKYTRLISPRQAETETAPTGAPLQDELPVSTEEGGDDPFDVEEEETPSERPMPKGLAVMVVLVLDVSGSLCPYATMIQKAFANLFESLRKNGTTRVCVDVLVVTFADQVKTFGFTPAESFTVPALTFGGMTNTGMALDAARETIEARWREYAEQGVSLNRVMEIVITDGHPSGSREEYQKAVSRHRAFEAQHKRVEVFPVAAGQAAMPSLAELSVGREPLLLDQTHWDELFAWIYQSSLVVSASIPGGRIDLPSSSNWSKTRNA